MRDRERHGTQAIERAAMLMREVALSGQFGARLTDLAMRCGLSKATAHRMLAALVREGLLQRSASDGRYLPGPMLFELGLSVPAAPALQAAAHAELLVLADRLGELAFLYLRSANDLVCAARVGATTLKGLLFDVGSRRPMVASAGGVAILLALPVDEADAIIAENLQRLAHRGPERIEAIERMISESRQRGYALNRGLIAPGVTALAVPVCDRAQRPIASVAVTGPSGHFPRERVAGVIRLLDETATRLAETGERSDRRGGDPRR